MDSKFFNIANWQIKDNHFNAFDVKYAFDVMYAFDAMYAFDVMYV